MSRSEYTEDRDSEWQLIMWRGAVASSIRGKRGQAFLKEMAAALDALPEKILVAESLHVSGAVCAIGSVGLARGIDMSAIDPEDHHKVAETFGVADALVREIVYMNDEYSFRAETPQARYERMRQWVDSNIKKGE